jgi:anthranilate synthase/aminodeoxychorismate synthase-like glutamine amidotransferase
MAPEAASLGQRLPKLLVVDNYDSFTFNVVAVLHRRAECLVVPNDAPLPDALEERFDGIVLSPGPCSPRESGQSLALVEAVLGGSLRLPLLGVCLGHQALAHVAGAEVTRAARPVHGKTVAVVHDGGGVFEGLPSPIEVARYNSLTVVERTLPSELVVTARSVEEGEVMGLRHVSLPVESVQFHPESHLSRGADVLLETWCARVGTRARAGEARSS